MLVRQGTQWEALSGDTRGAEDVLQWSDIAEQLLVNGPDKTPDQLTERAIGFPLIVGGAPMGVLGIRPEGGMLAADKRRIIDAAATLLAVSVKNAQLFRDVKENSVRDALTGCFTRGHALDVIDAELRRARRSQTPVSLIMFDLDHFKDVNDRHGHLCGDAVLAAVGKRMKEVLRGSDLRCRYGGEEFLVLLPETPLHGARRVADTLRREIAERPVPWSGEGADGDRELRPRADDARRGQRAGRDRARRPGVVSRQRRRAQLRSDRGRNSDARRRQSRRLTTTDANHEDTEFSYVD